MSETIKSVVEVCASLLQVAGAFLVVGFAAYALILAPVLWKRRKSSAEVFRATRHRLGRGILLGLEFLVAADIIHTVAVELTLRTVAILAVVVVIRTFLSFTLEVELTGELPWQRESKLEA